jgi:hypothetical protein
MATVATGLVALLVSFLPTAVLNVKHCGDWTGAKAEEIKLGRGDPRVTIPGNVLILALQNFVPPVFPLANWWNEHAAGFMPASFRRAMKESFEPSGADLWLPELQNEESVGLGFGVSCLVLVSAVAGWRLRRGANGGPRAAGIGRSEAIWLRLTPYVAAFGYCYKATLGTAARIFTPYYAPLLPMETILSALAKAQSRSPLWPRALTVYSVYALRTDGLAPVRAKLPVTARVVGLVTYDDLETSLWMPFGQRRFVHVATGDGREDLVRQGIEYVVVNPDALTRHRAESFEQWLTRFGGHVEATVPVRVRVVRGTVDWYVVRL